MIIEAEVVLQSMLGKCEHCRQLINRMGMSSLSLAEKDVCPHCGKELTPASFGNEVVNGHWQKTRWINQTGEWAREEPMVPFQLDNMKIVKELSVSQ